jgi:FSR family fosmidomycin resistance protein-like MFS transporter
LNKPVLIEPNTIVVEKDANATVPLAPTYVILIGLSFSHFLNDLMQSLLPSVYPLLKESYRLDFVQIGLITATFQITSSIFQPLVGLYTDRRPLPYSLSAGMASSFIGLIMLANAHAYWAILLSAALIGFGSAIFHPEAARVARIASGGRHGFAQSVFQLGGNVGNSVGPLLVALLIVPFGQGAIAWFSIVAALAMVVLFNIGRWYKPRIKPRKTGVSAAAVGHELSRARVLWAVGTLVVLLMSKQLYFASIGSYYTFYLIHKFGVSTQVAQIMLASFWMSTVAGVFLGGRLSDRFGRNHVLWFSVLGALPFSLVLPYVGLAMTGVLICIVAIILSCTTATIIVYGQELMPRNVGAVSGLFYGLAFGIGGIGAAVLGRVADAYGIEFVYAVCAFLPLLGFVAVFLPNTSPRKRARA